MRLAARERIAPLAVALALGLLVGLAPGAARAQHVEATLPDAPDAPSAVDREVARTAFLEGLAHAGQARWDAALEAFTRAYRLSGSPVALFNLASTLRSLDRVREASVALARLLEGPGLDVETVNRAEALLAEARARVALLTIEGVPDGPAEVRVDGGVRRRTVARPVNIELDPGLRTVRLELAPHPPFTWSEEVAPGARLAADTGWESEPEDAAAPVHEDQQDTLLLGGVIGGIAGAVLAALVIGLAVGLPPSLSPRTELRIALP